MNLTSKLKKKVSNLPRDCDKYQQMQYNAKDKLDDARSSRKRAKREYQSAQDEYDNGNLESAQEKQDLAKETLKKSNKQLRDAQSQISKALTKKRMCKGALQGANRAQKVKARAERQRFDERVGIQGLREQDAEIAAEVNAMNRRQDTTGINLGQQAQPVPFRRQGYIASPRSEYIADTLQGVQQLTEL